MTAIDQNGRPRHHGGAGRTIGQIYADNALRTGFRTRREIEAEQFKDGWPVVDFDWRATEPPVFELSADRVRLARHYQSGAAAYYAEAEHARNMVRLAPESAASIWVKTAPEFREEWAANMRLAARESLTARLIMGIDD